MEPDAEEQKWYEKIAVAVDDAIEVLTPAPVAAADDEAGRMLDWLADSLHGMKWGDTGLHAVIPHAPKYVEASHFRACLRAAIAQGGNNE